MRRSLTVAERMRLGLLLLRLRLQRDDARA
jgi:hypothetical protein